MFAVFCFGDCVGKWLWYLVKVFCCLKVVMLGDVNTT